MKRLFDKYNNFVFVGESGCGKTELALNFAREMAEADNQVILYDMDQTKPLFRARDAAFEKTNLEICWQEQLLDSPVVPPAVRENLVNSAIKVVLDVGGNELGVHMIGQYRDLLMRPDSIAFFVINPYRSWSESIKGIADTLSMVSTATGIENMDFVINPNVGQDTSLSDIKNGLRKMHSLLPEIKPAFIGITEGYKEHVKIAKSVPILEVRRYCLLPWERIEA